ncbi:hypothetical protein N657DRAFT_118664 [Parathielavia appendiculata]|uniref:Uncharacterized protein n=1 Tax=Parathielavia appendiculata TaxID=2587402 RepID=A0AAN6Z0L5_9PEZI|nr:hypothetical protein N657DRAFT_118664 [Parathielavia appendiculata]
MITSYSRPSGKTLTTKTPSKNRPHRTASAPLNSPCPKHPPMPRNPSQKSPRVLDSSTFPFGGFLLAIPRLGRPLHLVSRRLPTSRWATRLACSFLKLPPCRACRRPATQEDHTPAPTSWRASDGEKVQNYPQHPLPSLDRNNRGEPYGFGAQLRRLHVDRLDQRLPAGQ